MVMELNMLTGIETYPTPPASIYRSPDNPPYILILRQKPEPPYADSIVQIDLREFPPLAWADPSAWIVIDFIDTVVGDNAPPWEVEMIRPIGWQSYDFYPSGNDQTSEQVILKNAFIQEVYYGKPPIIDILGLTDVPRPEWPDPPDL